MPAAALATLLLALPALAAPAGVDVCDIQCIRDTIGHVLTIDCAGNETCEALLAAIGSILDDVFAILQDSGA